MRHFPLSNPDLKNLSYVISDSAADKAQCPFHPAKSGICLSGSQRKWGHKGRSAKSYFISSQAPLVATRVSYLSGSIQNTRSTSHLEMANNTSENGGFGTQLERAATEVQDHAKNALHKTQTASSISIDPALFERLYLNPEVRVKGQLRKTFANPTPLYDAPY